MEETNYPRPFVRFFAKAIDFSIYYALIDLISYLFKPVILFLIYTLSFYDTSSVIIMPYLLGSFLLFFFEAFVTYYFGNSLGRYFFNFKLVSQNGNALSFPQHVKRSFYLYVAGFGFIIFSLVTNIYWFIQLIEKNTTFWDKSADTKVIHYKINILKIIFGFILTIVLLAAIRGILPKFIHMMSPFKIFF
jgi:uncharacterized RDD family membrane protein YckC